MYTVSVKDHIMIAHSLPDARFGPAQHMHGATYIVTAEFKSESLNDMNVVIDIGEASNLLKKVLGELNYQNLDNIPVFKNVITTTEYLAQYIHDKVCNSLPGEIRLKITLEESHVASASYEK